MKSKQSSQIFIYNRPYIGMIFKEEIMWYLIFPEKNLGINVWCIKFRSKFCYYCVYYEI